MTNYPYDPTVPAANNAPKNDQPTMQTNTASTFGLIGVDHVGFNTTNGGAHKQVQLLNVSGGSGTIPAGLLGNGYETLYSSDTAGIGELWMVRGNSPTGIQLTGPGTPSGANTGYTFLPGGMLLQWGRKSFSGSSKQDVTINYVAEGNIAMPNATFIALATLRNDTNTSSTAQISTSTRTASGFVAHYTGGSDYDEFQWIAIGN